MMRLRKKDRIKRIIPHKRNVALKLRSTSMRLKKNPIPPLIKRTDEFKLAISGRLSSGKSVNAVEMPLWPMVHPAEIIKRMAARITKGYIPNNNIVETLNMIIPI